MIDIKVLPSFDREHCENVMNRIHSMAYDWQTAVFDMSKGESPVDCYENAYNSMIYLKAIAEYVDEMQNEVGDAIDRIKKTSCWSMEEREKGEKVRSDYKKAIGK